MTRTRNWSFSLSAKFASVVALLSGVVCVVLLFFLVSLRVEALAPASGASVGGASLSVGDLPAGSRRDAGLAVSGVSSSTVYLPMVARNAGSLPPLFGVQMYGAVTHTTGLDKVAGAGASWIRVPVSWASAEPVDRTPDQYNWRAIDAQVYALTGEGIEPLLTLSGNPSWAASYPMGPVADLADLQEFMGALVERFDGDGYQDAPGSPVVRYWEIYNEPDNMDEGHAAHGGYSYFGGRGDLYAATLDAVYPVMKAASPKAQVVFGGVAHDNFDYEGGFFDPDFVDDVLSNCTGPCFDVMNFHYFPYYRSRWEVYGRDVIGKANYFRAKLASYGLDRPLMCTETTWPAASIWGSAALQVRYVVAANVRGWADGLLLQNWFAWRDVDSSLPGLLDNELEPKSAYYAFQTMTSQLGQARYERPLTAGETGGGNIEGYVFSVPDGTGTERLDVIWYDCPGYRQSPPADCPPGASQTMVVAAPALQVTDLYGNHSVQYDADDGKLDSKVELQVGPYPVYVKYGAPSAGRSGSHDLSAAGALQRSSGGSRDDGVFLDGEALYPNCRFGVGAGSDVDQYDVSALNLGWYVDWGSRESPAAPAGLEYVQTIRLGQDGVDGWELVSPLPGRLTATVQANLGAMWLVGNEPDSPYQDDLVPEAYIHAYHDLYYQIKELDPSAQVAVGGVVQPTPLRFEYLDAVWDTYRQAYSETMPVDVWNIHSFILRETIDPPNPDPCGSHTLPVWGAYIPPGISAQEGELYCVRDQDDVQIFEQRIREFRQWMADKGERDKPLIVTEYGILFPEDYDDEEGVHFTQERVGTFMASTFDFFLNETDPLLGYPRDDNRLVQRWAWFSLSSDPFYWGGTLFDPDTHTLRPLGEYFRNYTTALSPTVDVLAVRAFAEPAVLVYDGNPVTVTLKALVSNAGNVATTGPITVTFYDGPAGGGDGLAIGEPQAIGESQVIAGGLQGCADYAEVTVPWKDLDLGGHSFSVLVQADGVDVDPSNNSAQGSFLLADHQVFLPLVVRNR